MVGISTEEARSVVQSFLANNLLGLPIFSSALRVAALRRLHIAIGDSKVADGVKFYGKSLSVGNGVTIGKGVRFYSEATIRVNDGAVIAEGAVLDTRVSPELRPRREKWAAPISIPEKGFVAAGKVISGSSSGMAPASD